MSITALPTPPSRQDPTNFNDRADAFLGALPTFGTQANQLADEVNLASANAVAANNAVISATNITKWVSGTTYANGAVVWSPINGMAYRRITTSGSGTTDPSLDTTNYKQISGTGDVNSTGDQTISGTKSFTGALNLASSLTLASASTVAIGSAVANNITISGSTTINAFDSVAAGVSRMVTFSNSLQLTYNATSMILPGAKNILTSAGDTAEFVSLGSGNWRCFSYQRANGNLVRNGTTDVVLTSSSPNATISLTANQVVNITTDATKPINPSITLPSMTTMPKGNGYFIVNNLTLYNIAVKDSGGIVREYIPPGSNISLNVNDNSSSTGKWFFKFPVSGTSVDNINNMQFINSLKVNSGYYINGTFEIMRMDNSSFVVIWTEIAGNYTNGYTYAKLFTVDNATKTISAGNTVTVISWPGYSVALSSHISCDSNGSGRGYVAVIMTGANYNSCYYAGLSVSGGVLYATTATSVVQNVFPCNGNGGYFIYGGYLGNNDTYTLCFTLYDTSGNNNTRIHIRSFMVTGTSVPILTNSASNVTVAQFASFSTPAIYGSRLSLTDFTVGWLGNNGRVVSCSPDLNTFSVQTRTNQSRFDIEQGSIAAYSSFQQGGYMFSSGKSVFGSRVYDVANTTSTNVTAVLSTGYAYKYNLSANFNTIKTSDILTTNRSSIYLGSTSIVAVGSDGRYQIDPSKSNLELQFSPTTIEYDNLIALIDSNLAIGVNIVQTAPWDTLTTMNANATFIDVPTPITA